MVRNICILGAAGRDYWNFLVKYKDDGNYDVKFFTAEQIPGIADRKFPRELAGKKYPKGIPIFPEKRLPGLIKKYKIDEVVFSYSDINHVDVMHKASIALANGATFTLLGPEDTMIKSRKKMISICAVRTGCGKSSISRKIAWILKESGKKVVGIRHPMPYGDLVKQKIQRFAEYPDLDKHKCTIEEREEYEPWIHMGIPIYSGVDYKAILNEAEKEADIIVWDGGNNDFPFYESDLHIVVADPHRGGHELMYHPGEANFRMADIIVINKVDSAPKEGIKIVEQNIKEDNPKAKVVKSEFKITVQKGINLRGKRVLVIEDGPTLTHGGMDFGAGYLAAKRAGAKIVKPGKYAVGSLKDTFKKFKHVENILPAMGYGNKQIKELETTINRVHCDIVLVGTPVDLTKILNINKPALRVNYEVAEKGTKFKDILKNKGFI